MNTKSRFVFLLNERNGILYLCCLLGFVLTGIYISKTFISGDTTYEFDKITSTFRLRAGDSSVVKNSVEYKFNPNFISDYYGYQLGMSIAEIDSLHAFRETGSYVRTAEEFQKVTGVSNQLLSQISGRFRFPKFTKPTIKAFTSNSGFRNKRFRVKKDLNSVDSLGLIAIYGIGPKLSARIIKYRDLLGGFYKDDQLYEVYGLEKEAAQRVLSAYTVLSAPRIKSKDINRISLKELTEIPYISYQTARSIIAYRTKVGKIQKIIELTKIQDFPAEKINIIEVYLTIK